MADAHAESGVVQQVYKAGLTRRADMVMTVTGEYVCDYCKPDLVSMDIEA
ncbi:hypothetical protein DBY65_014030 [Pseudomonas sp. RIT412]|nr:hypothetical protein DBP26_010805 [Pseudomonas sp. RIT 409]RAU53922.1 hypothetical protein DBY65_014030 [Pseudomonas sp. RIT 412]